nr:ribosome maturation factor RimM [Tanacetum cinerariifolium]
MSAQLDVDDAATYDKLKTVYLALPTAPTKLIPYQVERVNPQVGLRVLLKLRGIDRIEEAEPLRGSKLWLPLAELPALGEHQFYFHDVIGFQVIDEKEGALGVVENFYELPQQDVLAMRYKGQEVLLPVVDELPELLESPFAHSIVKRAQEKGLAEIHLHQLRERAINKHGQIDDYVFGGGAGMVLRVEPIAAWIDELQAQRPYDAIIYLTPDGETLRQPLANRLSLL